MMTRAMVPFPEDQGRKITGTALPIFPRRAILPFVFLLLSGLAPAAGFRNIGPSFFGVYGRQAMIMGRADGSAAEIWIHPYKVCHGLRFKVVRDGTDEDPYARITGVDFSPESFRRTFAGECWQVEEECFPAINDPVVIVVYRVRAVSDIELEISFRPDLSPMWPAALGGKYSYWDDAGHFVLSESTGRNTALIGAPGGESLGSLPAHNLPGGALRYRVRLARGEHELPLAVVAGAGKEADLRPLLDRCRTSTGTLRRERAEYFRELDRSRLRVETPDPAVNEALRWAVCNLDAAFVRNPTLGEGLVAGYGLSGDGERPGFAWYFGGDGVINSLGLLDAGDFAGVAREIEFLFRYQRADGKIMHELAQGAGFVKWFEDYGFPYFHGDTTLFFTVLLNEYLRRTGDDGLIRKHAEKIGRVFDWMQAVDSDDDGIAETRLAGTGASETGPLRQKMKTDILLASLSVKAWQAMAALQDFLGNAPRAGAARAKHLRAQAALESLFWDDAAQSYAYAVREDGSRIAETTIWSAVALRFGIWDGGDLWRAGGPPAEPGTGGESHIPPASASKVAPASSPDDVSATGRPSDSGATGFALSGAGAPDGERLCRARCAAARIASPDLSADWGTRFLSSRSSYYDPSSYNNGAVWPFLSGLSSLGLYRYDNPWHAWSLLRANLQLILDYDYGAGPELLSGDLYRPVDESVSNQIWSSGTTVAAFVEGLLGFSADVPARWAALAPAIPPGWEHLVVENLRVGGGSLRLDYRRRGTELVYELECRDLAGFTLNFAPVIQASGWRVAELPAAEGKDKRQTAGRDLQGDSTPAGKLAAGRHDAALSVTADRQKFTVRVSASGIVDPFTDASLTPGQPSRRPIIENLRVDEKGFALTVWGRDEGMVDIFSDRDFSPDDDHVRLGEETTGAGPESSAVASATGGDGGGRSQAAERVENRHGRTGSKTQAGNHVQGRPRFEVRRIAISFGPDWIRRVLSFRFTLPVK